MNWKRIGIGTLWAAVTLLVLDWANILVGQWLFGPGGGITGRDILTVTGLLIVPSAVTGFLLAWLYALVRPRLGPGPRSALLIGAAGFLLGNQHLLSPGLWISSPGMGLYQTVVPMVKFLAAACVAGWLYIEQSPAGF